MTGFIALDMNQYGVAPLYVMVFFRILEAMVALNSENDRRSWTPRIGVIGLQQASKQLRHRAGIPSDSHEGVQNGQCGANKRNAGVQRSPHHNIVMFGDPTVRVVTKDNADYPSNENTTAG